ncbi:MAG: hypothetical protein LBQ24_03035 [Candidatus Peribacteria bacterium]|jgi:hypothetical protein|nr:hypothetical protein [Candidatus Peribacteria bacterium]
MVSSLLENVKRLTLYQISEILDNKKPLTSDEIEKLKIKSQLKEIKLAQLILATQAEIRRIMKIINN